MCVSQYAPGLPMTLTLKRMTHRCQNRNATSTLRNINMYIKYDFSDGVAGTLQSADSDTELREMCMLMEDDDPEGFVVNHSVINKIKRIARAAHMNHEFTILQHSFFGHKPSSESIPRTLLSNGDIIHGNLIQHHSVSSVSSEISLNSSNLEHSHLGSFRSVDSNISQSSVPSLSATR